MIDINKMTLGELKAISKLFNGEEKESKQLELLLDKQITIFGVNYIYHGTLISYNSELLSIDNAKIVYETGSFSKSFKDAQNLESSCIHIQRCAIESFGILPNKND